jgi:putative acetyltransferase
VIIRREVQSDVAAISEVVRLAFGRDAEALLVVRLRDAGLVVASLVAEDKDALVGHVLFSRLPIHTDRGVIDALALAPLAVIPEQQRRGIGSMLVRDGLELLANDGESIVIVVGEPRYYSRFGFSAELTRNLRSPFRGEAFMALELVPRALAAVAGDVRYPAAFSSGV